MNSVFARKGSNALLLAASLMAGLPAASGQGPIQSVITYRVKPDRAMEWRDLRKQVVAIYKKAGIDYNSTVWQAQSGPMEYGVVRYYAKWADVGSGPDTKLKEYSTELTSLNSRMMMCLESMERRLGTVTDWSLRPTPGAPMPKMVRLLKTSVRQGHMDTYMNLVKAESLPAYKQAGVKMLLVTQPRYGTSMNEVYSVIPMDWADLDGPNPLEKSLGKDGSAALLKKMDEHVVRREAVLYRFMAELSHVATAGSGASSGN